MYTKSLPAFLVVLTFFSCKYRFDKKDLSILNTYNIGDTLVFQSDKGLYDSIEILDKQFRFNGLSEGYMGNPESAYVVYKTIPAGKPELIGFGGPQGDIYSNEKNLLSGVKWKKDKADSIDVKYNGFQGKFPDSQKLKNDDEIGEHYEITHFCMECRGIEATHIIRIKWKPGTGIVWYQRKDSSIYKLVRRSIY